MGRYVPRGPRDKPRCDLCYASLRWTPENRGVYRRWQFHRAGLPCGAVGEREAWAFFRLEEAAREIEAVRLARSVNTALVGAFGDG